MGAMFIGQQFLQNVLGYSPWRPGAPILPAAVFMVLSRPVREAGETRGARFTLLVGSLVLLGFLRCCCSGTRAAYWWSGIATFSSAPGSASPARRPPIRSRVRSSDPRGHGLGHADLHEIWAGPSCSRSSGHCSPPVTPRDRSGDRDRSQRAAGHDGVQGQLTKSFASAETSRSRYPEYATQITAAAKASFLDGAGLGLYRWDRRHPPWSDHRFPPLPSPRGTRSSDSSRGTTRRTRLARPQRERALHETTVGAPVRDLASPTRG